MEINRIYNMDLDSLIRYYKRHKYRKCNGFFDAKVRGSINRKILDRLKNHFQLNEDKIKEIDKQIDRKVGKI